MASTQTNIPVTQSALQWVRVSDKNPFEWNPAAPVVQPSQLGDSQVLIRNHAATLNPLDYKMAALNFSQTILPAVVGYDVSGEIVAVGKDVKDFKVGDEVFGYLNVNSSNGGGAFQQYTVADAEAIAKKPANLSHTLAATLGIAFLTAMEGLRQVNIDSSTTVFIPGGSGGVGHFAVQIAQIRGAKEVITSASKDDGIKILQEQYHVKHVINHAKENVADRVRELTDGKGVDVVYDSTYMESSFEQTVQAVKEGGSWIVLGHFGGKNTPEAKAVAERKAHLLHADLGRYWFGPERSQMKSFVQASLEIGAQWTVEGKIKPYINHTIKLEEVSDWIEKIRQGKGGFGKIVVQIL